LRFSTDCGDLADRQIVIEAVIENEDEKTSVFGRLDKVVDDPQAILASNTSSIPIMKLGMATSRPAQVVGIHFFIAVPVLKLVERYVDGLEARAAEAAGQSATASLQAT
jgi:3-hydroxybutyryl-CoA dehydrogenase